MPKRTSHLRDVTTLSTGELMAELATRRFDWTEQTWNDDANAERYVRDHGDNVLYVPEKDLFLVWDDARGWVPDRSRLAVETLAVQTARGITTEAAHAATVELNDAKASRLMGWANTSRSGAHTRQMYERARGQLQRPLRDFDDQPRTLAFQNGVVDLETGDFRPHGRTDLFTMRLAFDYDPKATCPAWDAFLESSQPDPALRDFLHRAAGMTALGEIRDQYLFICYGPPRAGKGTFVGTLQRLFGEYHHALSQQLLLARSLDGSTRFKLAELDGRRMSACDELPRNARLNSAVLNSLVSGDAIEVEAKYRDPWTMRPVATYWINTNHKPDLPVSEEATWKRLRLIPFEQSFVGREDESLRETLAGELPGIANWLVRGAVSYLAAGRLTAPDRVLRSVADFHRESDVLQQFLAAETAFMASRPTMTPGRYGRPNVMEALVEWCDGQGREAPRKADVSAELKRAGWLYKKAQGLRDGDGDVIWRWHAPLEAPDLDVLTPLDAPDDKFSYAPPSCESSSQDRQGRQNVKEPTTGTRVDFPALMAAAERPRTAAEEEASVEAMWTERWADLAAEYEATQAEAEAAFEPA